MDITQQGNDNIWRASEIDKGSKCLRQLGYSRLGVKLEPGTTGVPVRPQYSWNLIGGIAMDDTLCAFSRAQIDKDGEFAGTMVASYYAKRLDDNYNEFSSKGDIVGEDTSESCLTEGTQLLDMYVRDLAPIIHPVGVQVEASIQIDDITLVGHIDLIRDTGTSKIISDWKFTKMTANQMPASGYARGWAYDLMAGDGNGQIELILLRRGLKNPKIETTSHFVTSAQHKQVVRQTKTLSDMYRDRYFPMTDPSSWWCSPKFCGFWSICRGNPNGPARIPGEVGI